MRNYIITITEKTPVIHALDSSLKEIKPPRKRRSDAGRKKGTAV
jgi:hypothetical protein